MTMWMSEGKETIRLTLDSVTRSRAKIVLERHHLVEKQINFEFAALFESAAISNLIWYSTNWNRSYVVLALTASVFHQNTFFTSFSWILTLNSSSTLSLHWGNALWLGNGRKNGIKMHLPRQLVFFSTFFMIPTIFLMMTSHHIFLSNAKNSTLPQETENWQEWIQVMLAVFGTNSEMSFNGSKQVPKLRYIVEKDAQKQSSQFKIVSKLSFVYCQLLS